MRDWFTSLLTVFGLLVVAAGLGLISPPLGLIGLGVAFVVVGETEGRKGPL